MTFRRLPISARSLSTGKVSKDMAMPTPMSMGFNITYHEAPVMNRQSKKCLAVVAGWMGAKQSQLKPYLNFYHKRGIDTLSFAVGPGHVLQPKTATKQMQAVMEHIHKVSKDSSKHDAFLFHHFSVGGFLYGQMLRQFESDPAKHNEFKSKIQAQIFDSPPDFNGIAKGISKSMGIGGGVEKIVELGVSTYLKLAENSAGAEHKASSHAFHNNFVPAPALWFYSNADPVARSQDCEIVISKWRALGTHVETCVWQDTPHIQHARKDPERYFGTLENFLLAHQVLETKKPL